MNSAKNIAALLAAFVFLGSAAGYIMTNAPTVNAQTITAPASTVFTQNLTIGDSGADVLALQQFLNANNYLVASTGPGSPGSETSYFGSLTQSALARWQSAMGISPAVGYFGPITMAAVNSNSNRNQIVPTPVPSSTFPTSTITTGTTTTSTDIGTMPTTTPTTTSSTDIGTIPTTTPTTTSSTGIGTSTNTTSSSPTTSIFTY